MYQTIALAISGHDHEQAHIDHAINLARLSDAALHCIHITPILLVPTGYATGTFAEVVIDGSDPCDSETALEQYINRQASESLADLRWSWEVRRGDCLTELTRISQNVDLIILGHHHSGFLHLFMRTEDERLIGRAACPVLVVPEATND